VPGWQTTDLGATIEIADPPIGAPAGSGRFQFTAGVPIAGLAPFLKHVRDRTWITHSYRTGEPVATRRLLSDGLALGQ
jgi:hypothetical protein